MINIGSHVGDRVIFSNPDDGYPFDQKLCAEHLEVGVEYTIAKLDVGRFRSSVRFDEVPSVYFNTVMFDNVPREDQ